ncbi:L-lactate dehydrogenase complex protein LldG [Micromonospora echinaurantiaca]|uniref:L-lactate dehydrogenase complex protein LldG n=1 Tax=Micromonospora echinaurantiaca TaxID=47857 RepID=A0A1C5HK07_9ACTN|nr:LUD domain-containing protein [Micromonospora echinaurantiaca]SCG45871.1 L-lactate dehydrogenase complex protein LldG [Micromonospora echinaurantiaca]
MSSRDLVLGRLRAALGPEPAGPAEVPREYRPAGRPAHVDLLARRLTDYRATVHRCADGEVARVVDDILGILDGRRVVVPPGLPRRWLPATVEAVTDDRLGTELLSAVDGVVTAAALAIAETGTIVLDGAPDQGRRIITLLPDVHVCVLRADQVVAGLPDAVGRLDPRRPLTWISGPSATSDIELDRVEGVHGPRNLHVVILPPTPDPAPEPAADATADPTTD